MPSLDNSPVDERSEAIIATLHDEVKPYARTLVKLAAAEGIVIKVISGLRTYDEQDELYAQGRTASGPRVTNARGGYSNHNFGIAFDVGIFQGHDYLDDSPLYRTVGALGKSLGLEWGGDWTAIDDEPHFELRPTWAQHLTESVMLAGLRDRFGESQDPFV